MPFPLNKIYCNDDALDEHNNIRNDALNNAANLGDDIWINDNKFIIKIISLNIQNLFKHLNDLKADPTVLKGDIICLQETCYDMDIDIPQIPEYTCQLAGKGKGIGVATYVKDNIARDLQSIETVTKDFIQYIKLSFKEYNLITIYQPPSESNIKTNLEVETIIKDLISCNKPTVINGECNFDYRHTDTNLSKMLVNQCGFTQIVKEPTTYLGKCIDYFYVKNIDVAYNKLYYPYYSDHEAVCVALKKGI